MKKNTETEKKDDFKTVAREHECDESEAAFDTALKKIGKVMPDLKGVTK